MAKKSTAKKSARKPNAAFMKPMTPSSSLAEVVGTKPIPRTEVTKKLWAYIKKNGLQDKKNKRMIKSDDALKPVFGGKATVNMFEMTKLVSKHLKSPEGKGRPGLLRAPPFAVTPLAHHELPGRAVADPQSPIPAPQSRNP